ncbi:MAG TPA: DUF748 domain-containing protein [Methylomirabilota bacterium]|nr:DUF748 domain-containing protein [Methylomirabilota bacterium]
MQALGRLRIWIAALVLAVLVVGGVGLAILPRVVRHTAITQLAKMTGRPVALDAVELNLFTGRVALKGFRLGQRGSDEPALAFERVDLRLALAPLILKHARVTELSVDKPSFRVARTGPDTFDFSDLLALIPPADPAKPPSKWVVTLDRVSVRDLTLVARDAVPSPATEWTIAGFGVEASGLTTTAGATPGKATLKGRLNGTPFALEASSVALGGGAVTARVSLDGLPLASVAPYVPSTLAVLPRAGALKVALVATLPGGGVRGEVSGDITIERLEVVRRDGGGRVVAVPRLAVAIKRADLASRAVTLASLEIERLALGATRAANGDIDLLRLLAPPPAASAPPTAAAASPAPVVAAAGAPAASAPPFSLKVERLAVTDADLELTDEAVTPKTTLRLAKMSATVRDFTWPVAGPAAVELATMLPAAGRVTVKGAVTALPLDADLAISLRGGSIAPYGPYFPFKARFAGSFNADSRWRVRLVDGALTAVSTGGESWIDGAAVTAADAEPGATPLARTERLTFSGIDFAWPKYARVRRVTFLRPDVRIERERDGTMSFRRIFAVPDAGAAPAAPAKVATAATPPPAATPVAAGAEPKPLPITVDFAAIVVEDGFARFVDRAVEPPFSESISRLAISIEGLSSTPGRRAALTAQAIVGGNAALDVRGQLAPLGRLYADLSLELRDFALPSVTSYVDRMVAWKIERGTMVAKLHYTIDGDQLTARNEVTLGGLEVARSAAAEGAEKRLGLPLGLIVALIKDGDGRIRVDVPMAGSLSDPKFDLSETIWTAIRNVVVNVVAAPFRAIGRLFTSGDNKIERLAVEPVVFEPGAATLTPAMDKHLLRVADFLKGAPGVTLGLLPVATGRDAESLRAQELTARLQSLQRERKLPDYAAAVAAEFRARFPDVKTLPTTDEQVTKLSEREPLSDTRVAELRARRLQVVQDALVGADGVPAARLTAVPGPETVEAGEGRVDFRIGP